MFNTKRSKLIVASICLLIVVAFVIVFWLLLLPSYHYKQGQKLIEEEEYQEAIVELEKAKDYKNSEDLIVYANKGQHYKDGILKINEKNYIDAVSDFVMADDFPNAKNELLDAGNLAFSNCDWSAAIIAYDTLNNSNLFENNQYANGSLSLENGDYKNAYLYFVSLDDFLDSSEKTKEASYKYGQQLFEDSDYHNALEAFKNAGDYQDADIWYIKALYQLGKESYNNKDYKTAASYFHKTIEYEDSSELEQSSLYEWGKEQYNDEKYEDAATIFKSIPDYKDSLDWMNNSYYLLAESFFKKSRYDSAKEYYELLPEGFSMDNSVSCSERLNSISIFKYYLEFAGSYTCDSGYMEVRQTSKEYGSWHNWYKDTTDGHLTIKVEMKDNGEVIMTGQVNGKAFNSYSSIAAGVRSNSISASFSITLLSKELQSVLYDEKDMKIEYLGGKYFSFNYYRVDTNKDVYFNYMYWTKYSFSKE